MSIVSAPPPPIHLKPGPSLSQIYSSQDTHPKLRPQPSTTSSSDFIRLQAQGFPESPDSESSIFSSESPGQALSTSTPSASVDLPDNTNQITRDWSVPSRPKPGRKPAVDTPPTKRKAQNRAAQRAFRQRRAAEVGDLQEQLNQKQDEHDKKEVQWDVEKQRYQQNVEQWRKNAEYWQQATNKEQARVKELEAQVLDLQNQLQTSLRNSSRGSNGSILPSLMTDRSNPWDQSSHMNAITHTHSDPNEIISLNNFNQISTQDLAGQTPIDRMRNNDQDDSQPAYDEMEIDFTAAFAKPMTQNSDNTTRNTISHTDFGTPSMILPLPIDDGCGFCDPGGLCVCKEIAAESTAMPEENITLPSMSSISESVSLASTPRAQIMEPRATATGPGTCPACMADPERQSFCRSLAGLMPPPPLPRPNSSTSSIASQTSSNNKRRRIGCSNHSSNQHNSEQPKKLTCAETFNRLKQIPNFREHKDEIIHHLTAEPTKGDEFCDDCEETGCAPLAVDSATFDAAILLTGLKDPTNFANGLTEKQTRKQCRSRRQK